ncbi:uncharacterized protein BDZ99DRAFT_463478 [Mytilinidion resinicola]|uniref:Uncharacterized protein n=1 Tax=Mytilinidion resinicola TaxID=574789 RepID=A0A6A6YMD8_9PEZI|nr:uncharacterized protein BDZ99DRAFT_463478 [Mytilinidion resinicola]KAF2809708.1 hypothetical protein BDZ99DRAFT_463478 [Mytilinidion resinicola]
MHYSLLALSFFTLTSAFSPTILVPDAEIHLIPHHTLFSRQVSNLQTFNGSLGGAAPAISNSGDPKRPFEVDGDTFTDFKSAAQRTCDNQANTCSEAANDAKDKGPFSVNDCNSQRSELERGFPLCLCSLVELTWMRCGMLMPVYSAVRSGAGERPDAEF